MRARVSLPFSDLSMSFIEIYSRPTKPRGSLEIPNIFQDSLRPLRHRTFPSCTSLQIASSDTGMQRQYHSSGHDKLSTSPQNADRILAGTGRYRPLGDSDPLTLEFKALASKSSQLLSRRFIWLIFAMAR